jgi:hypothetical protein
MELRTTTPTAKAPAACTGDLYVTAFHSGHEPSKMTAALVHAVGQTVHDSAAMWRGRVRAILSPIGTDRL